jgi:hypothetical protein
MDRGYGRPNPRLKLTSRRGMLVGRRPAFTRPLPVRVSLGALYHVPRRAGAVGPGLDEFPRIGISGSPLSENTSLLGSSVNKGLGGRRPTQVPRRLGPQVL